MHEYCKEEIDFARICAEATGRPERQMLVANETPAEKAKRGKYMIMAKVGAQKDEKAQRIVPS